MDFSREFNSMTVGKFFGDIQYFNPKNVPNLALWLDGPDPAANGVQPALNASVGTWVDKSGNGINFTQATAANQPLFITNYQGNLGALLFDGLTDQLSVAYNALLNTSDTSVFVVCACNNATSSWGTPFAQRGVSGTPKYGFNFYKTAFTDPVDSNKWQVLLGNGTSGFNAVKGPVMTLNKNTLLSLVGDGAVNSATFFVDGTTIGSNTFFSQTSGSTVNVSRIGAINEVAVFFFTGMICEIIIYSSVVSAAQRQIITQYLKKKWVI